jgi:hypothetical protein
MSIICKLSSARMSCGNRRVLSGFSIRPEVLSLSRRPSKKPAAENARREQIVFTSSTAAGASGECVALTRRVRGENLIPLVVALRKEETFPPERLAANPHRLSKVVRLFGLRAVSPKKRVNASSRARSLNKPRAARPPDTNGSKLYKSAPLRVVARRPSTRPLPEAVNLTRHADKAVNP